MIFDVLGNIWHQTIVLQKIIGIQFISSLFKSIKITRMWVNKIT